MADFNTLQYSAWAVHSVVKFIVQCRENHCKMHCVHFALTQRHDKLQQTAVQFKRQYTVKWPVHCAVTGAEELFEWPQLLLV